MKPLSKSLSKAVSFLLLALSSESLPACTNCPVHGYEPVTYKSGRTNSTGEVYESNAVDEAWLPFSSGTVYDFPHGLGLRPYGVYTYVSFDEHPLDGVETESNRPDHVSESAGNQAVIERWDDKTVRVRNDTCASFYLRVVVMADASSGGAGGAF